MADQLKKDIPGFEGTSDLFNDLVSSGESLVKKYKNPIEQANDIIKGDKPTALKPIRATQKSFDKEKYDDIVDFISIYRGDGVSLEDIQNQLLEDYPDDQELVRHALSKWAE